jgi:hypothetical protein
MTEKIENRQSQIENASELPHNRYHRAAKSSAAMAIVYAAMAGRELTEVRKKIPHGEWEKWVEENCEFNTVTAWRYTELAARLSKQLQIFKHLKICSKSIDNKGDTQAKNEGRESLCRLLDRPPSELLPEDTEKLLAELRKATKGETLHQLYWDFGLVSIDKRRGGAREHPKVELPAGETQAHLNAVDVWTEIMNRIHVEITSYQSLQNLTLPELKDISERLLSARRAVEDLIKKG